MKKLIAIILNLPWTIISLIAGLLSLPTKVIFKSTPPVMILSVKSLWWTNVIPGKVGARAIALGNAVLLGPNIDKFDLEHELIHIEQYTRTPFLHEFFYFFENLRHPSPYNKYEREAYIQSGSKFRFRDGTEKWGADIYQ